VIERIGFGRRQVDSGTFRVRLSVGEPLTVGLDATLGARQHAFTATLGPAIAGLNVRELPIDKVNARSNSPDISLIEDVFDDQANCYTLQKLHDEGVNCVWLQVPCRLDPWNGRDTDDTASDDAGSDYASNDWFSIGPDLSRDSRGVPPWGLDRQHRLANAAMKRLVDTAHSLGMTELLKIVPNHVGHNFMYRDVVGKGRGTNIPLRDYSLWAIDGAQLAQIQQRLNPGDHSEELKNFAE
jgi:hypothetical protein